MNGRGPFSSAITRRGALSAAALLGAGVVAERVAAGSGGAAGGAATAAGAGGITFYGRHQAGVTTPVQPHLSFAAFDLAAPSRARLRELLQRWTAAAEAATSGREYSTPAGGGLPTSDPGESAGMSPSRLTLTFGFGPALFDKAGLGAHRPPALAPLPQFAGDRLDPQSSGGDLCVQACADDPQIAFHAIHLLAQVAGGHATLRWLQAGFRGTPGVAGQTGRNLLGFKDGTNNLDIADTRAMDSFVWAGPSDEPAWMSGGSYLVARRIEIVFSAWDGLSVGDQEAAIGRYKGSGAPLGARHERDPVNLAAHDSSGRPVIPLDAHVRVAGSVGGQDQKILRRSYGFSRGLTPGPIDQGGQQLDGGLFFIAFTRDPTTRLVPLLRRVAQHDALTTFTVHTASAIFAVAPGVEHGGFIGQQLLDA